MKTIELGNDYEFDFEIWRRNTGTGDWEPASGVTGLTAGFSLEESGASLLPDTETAVSERSGAPGRVYGTLGAAAVDAALAPYVGRILYPVLLGASTRKTEGRLVVAAGRLG